MKKAVMCGIAALLVICFALATGYVSDYYRADEAAAAAMAGAVEQKGMLCFGEEGAEAGLIFYPGGKVEHTAYAPLMNDLAARGVFCVLIDMPLNLAVLDMNAAEGIAQQYPAINRWYIGGHSLGGSMAAAYAAEHAEELEGLILLAAYSTADLSGAGIDVLSLYGSEDCVLNMQKYGEYRANLPSDLQEHVIEGGNHAGFGDYGPQDGDGVETISKAEQWRITADRIIQMIETGR